MKAVVLAAGRGERLWPLTEGRPKHLLPVAGIPVVERTLAALSGGGIDEVILVVNYLAKSLEKRVGDGKSLGCKISYVKQKSLGGTADALESSRELLTGHDSFVVIYGDDYYETKAVARFLKDTRKGGMMIGAANVPEPSRFGLLNVREGLVRSIREKASDGTKGLVNAGIYLLEKSIFRAIHATKRSVRGEFELTDSIQSLIGEGQSVRAFPIKEKEWTGISYPWDLLDANKNCLETGPTLSEGEIEEGAQVRGPASLAKGAHVKAGSYLEGPVSIGEGSMIGPNAYVRPYTSIGKNVKVGAGCEVKNSIIMDNSKIPHLSYVGDSIIGEASSLGAGTITANLRFDESSVKSKVRGRLASSGRKKLGAVIGDNVRTGIRVSLYPGVKIGSGTWIWPGATVERDVPSGARFKA